MIEDKHGQLTLFDTRKPKAPVWRYSLTWIHCTCPDCKREVDGNESKCPHCAQPFDLSDEAIEKAKRMTPEYAECERLGLHGGVRKNKKGQWYEVTEEMILTGNYPD